MLTKNDLLLLLTEIQESSNVNVDIYLSKLLKSDSVNIEVLKYINDNRQLDVANFYDMIRKNYNHKKSPLYRNIVKEEVKDAKEVLTTLSALQLQILLYAGKLEDTELFLKHSRLEEITRVINNYARTYDLKPCFKVLKLVKADLKAFESIR